MRFVSFNLLCCLALLLTACEGIKRTLGLEKDPPDEFAVYKRAPLDVPPGFGALPDHKQDLPQPEASSDHQDTSADVVGTEDQRPQETPPIVKAQKSVFGQTLPQTPKFSTKKFSPGEAALIHLVEKELAAIERPEDIRKKLDEETRIKTKTKKSFIQKLLFWQKDREKAKEAINPSEEYQRLHGTHPAENVMAY